MYIHINVHVHMYCTYSTYLLSIDTMYTYVRAHSFMFFCSKYLFTKYIWCITVILTCLCIPTVHTYVRRYTITPKEDINFGAVVLNNKKTLTLGIENGGIFEFRYTMTKPNLGEQGPRGTSIFMSTAATKRARSRESVTSIGRTSQMVKSRKPDGSLLRYGTHSHSEPAVESSSTVHTYTQCIHRMLLSQVITTDP